MHVRNIKYPNHKTPILYLEESTNKESALGKFKSEKAKRQPLALFFSETTTCAH